MKTYCHVYATEYFKYINIILTIIFHLEFKIKRLIKRTFSVMQTNVEEMLNQVLFWGLFV